MKQFSKSICSLFLITILSLPLFAQKIDGTYPAFEKFYDACYHNLNRTGDEYTALFQDSLQEAQAVSDEFERTIRLAWTNYIMGYTFSSLGDLESVKKYADIAETYAKQAVDTSETEDSLLIYANTIGLNCVVKPLSYLMKNGANINPLAKKTLKLNPKNGRAVFLRESQYIYGPAIIANAKRGLQSMLDILADTTLETSDQLIFDVNCAAAFALIKLNRIEEAKTYLTAAGQLFPDNISYIKTMEYFNK